jgi:enoyl-CoA hydratase/carnithine racemase
MSEHVKTELSNGVLVLTLQRPDKKNALTGAMYNALSDTLDRAEADASVKVVRPQRSRWRNDRPVR